MHRAIVIGAGIGGIASAIRLAVKGYQVTVLESASRPGGKLNELRLGEYRFDKGPSLFTLPHLVDDLFQLAGENPRDHFQYRQLESITKYHYADGLVLNAWQDPKRLASEIEEKTQDSAEQFLKYLTYSQRIYELTNRPFLFSSFHKFSTYFSKPFFKALVNLPALDVFRTMHRANEQFFSDPHLVQLFDRYATYNGSNPYQAPATLNVIPHLEHSIGAFFPEQGMYSITTSLVGLAKRLGVQFHFDTPAKRIHHKRGHVAGVETAEDILPAKIVVSDIDIHQVYSRLLPDVREPRRLLDQPKSTSAMVFYWGVDRQFPELDLHNIFFSGDYRQEFKNLFEVKGLNTDPTIYVFISSKQVKGDAPVGHENWFTMINMPNNEGQDWDSLVRQQRAIILAKLEKSLGTNMEHHITAEHIWDARGIEQETSSYRGALYGNSSNNRLAAFLRHPNFSRKVCGLYFVGGSVHPGGGIPLCLAGASIVDHMIKPV